MLENLKGRRIFLASKSPRRRELLHTLNIPYETINLLNVDESYPSDMPAEEIPSYLAAKKGEAYISAIEDDDIVITADTLVIADGKILGKPKDYDEAVEMLRFLSGKTHKVITGVNIGSRHKRVNFSVITDVKFAEIEDSDIHYYVDTYHPFDKAGGYGIQEWIGCVAVESIDGSFYNVMGLPVQRLYEELKKY